MSNHDDFWTSLAAGHTNTVLAGAMDSHLSGKSIDESFGSVRTLTDVHRQANALSLPVEAGTKVVFAGGLGAHMSYDDVPADGITGEVVTVKSATGSITHHDGKVFVKWADGKFRPIHAEHLRLAGHGKAASDIKATFEKIKAVAEKRPDSKFLKSLLEQMADKGFAPTEKQMAVVKKIEDEIKQQSEMKKELKGLDKEGGRKVFEYEDFGSTLEFAEKLGWKDVYGDGEDDDYDADAIEGEALDYIKRKGYRVKMSGFDASTIGERKGKPIQMDDEDKDSVGNFGQGEHHDLTEVAKGKTATFRVASLGDLTQFLKVADGTLVHKSTKDLWSFNKDADGNFLVSRLFDDEGEPLKV